MSRVHYYAHQNSKLTRVCKGIHSASHTLHSHSFRGLWLSSCLGSGRRLYCWSVMDEKAAWTMNRGVEKKNLLCLRCVPSLLQMME